MVREERVARTMLRSVSIRDAMLTIREEWWIRKGTSRPVGECKSQVWNVANEGEVLGGSYLKLTKDGDYPCEDILHA